MKPTGISWLPRVPDGWEVFKVAHGFSVIGSGTTPDTEDAGYYDGDIMWVTTSELRETVIVETTKKVSLRALREHSALKLFPPSTLLIAMYGATIGRLGILANAACVNQACCALSGGTTLSEPFVYYWLVAFRDHLIQLASGGGQPNISQEKVRSIRIPAPDRVTQQRIASFLDRKTAVMDELIAKKERLVELLAEKRQALITQLVTKGLDPNTPMKDSGVGWAGEVPRHWRVLALKRFAKLGFKSFTDGDWIESPYITNAGVRLLQTGNVGIGVFKEQGFRYVSDATFDELRCTRVDPGEVLICRLDGPVGRACLAPDLGVRAITSVDNAILKPSADHNPGYIVYVLSTPKYLDWVQGLCRVGGGFRFRISRSMLGDFPVPAPPRAEQDAICARLDAYTNGAGTVERQLGKSIDRLREYRQALITAAVTGQLDVGDERAVAAHDERVAEAAT